MMSVPKLSSMKPVSWDLGGQEHLQDEKSAAIAGNYCATFFWVGGVCVAGGGEHRAAQDLHLHLNMWWCGVSLQCLHDSASTFPHTLVMWKKPNLKEDAQGLSYQP